MNDIRTRDNAFKIPYKVIGIIVDNKDPLNRGRLKVRIPELISDEVSNANLPWAETQGSLFGADMETIGDSSVPKIGTFVYIEFLYHNPSYPLVTGVVRGKKDSSLLQTKESLVGTIYETRNNNIIGPELEPLNNNTIYPNNNVIETDTAVIEIDDTSSNKRISIQHKNGSYVEIRPDGAIQIKAKGKLYELASDEVHQYYNTTLEQIVNNGRTIQTKTSTHIGDIIIAGDVIVSGNVIAKDCISSGISGNSHTHPGDSGGTTGGPQ
jgi:hypothetical protein